MDDVIKFLESGTLRQFIIGGLIVAGTSYLAVYVNPVLASIFWSFPMSLLPVIVFMWIHNKPRSDMGDYALSTTVSLINLALFITVFGLLMKYTQNIGVFEALLIASAFWAIGSLLLYYLYLRGT